MNRSIWLQNITEHGAPDWPCPECSAGVLQLDRDSLISHETETSKRDREDAEWDPEWIREVFTAWLACIHSNCGARVAVSGTARVELDFAPDGGMEAQLAYKPSSLLPMPDMFHIPSDCPPTVVESLRYAFAAFWPDRRACANHLRAALEQLMDAVNLPAEEEGKRLTLQKRLELFAAGEPAIGDRLIAVKWLGNTGSHGEDVAGLDLLDAMQLIEHALEELVEKRSRKLDEIAKRLHARHAP